MHFADDAPELNMVMTSAIVFSFAFVAARTFTIYPSIPVAVGTSLGLFLAMSVVTWMLFVPRMNPVHVNTPVASTAA